MGSSILFEGNKIIKNMNRKPGKGHGSFGEVFSIRIQVRLALAELS